jgi:hypothetical protein
MSKNKGGREVRKPKQVKKPEAPTTALQPLATERAGRQRPKGSSGRSGH